MAQAGNEEVITLDREDVRQMREEIRVARAGGGWATFKTFTRLSGPGWLQSAITLGGGSLAGSLYLGVLGGFSFLWLQPIAMLMGIIMLSSISYVSLSTGQRPFSAINRHVNPVLGWGWIIATLMANIVWSLPQFSLASASVSQNLLPGLLGPGTATRFVICVLIAAFCLAMAWSYGSGSFGVKVFHVVLKLMVAGIIVSFFGVVVRLSLSSDALHWGEVFKGLIPAPSLLVRPAPTLTPYLDQIPDQFRSFWESMIVGMQRDVMITAAATAVGINMTFLLPYSILKRGWDRDFRGLAGFDLATGLFIPFILVTACVVIASAVQFHAIPAGGVLAEDITAEAPPRNLMGGYRKMITARLTDELGADTVAAMSGDELAAAQAALPYPERRVAAMLVTRDAFNLADSLSPLTGRFVAHYVFGIGVVGMAISSIIILMVINGFVICEMFDLPWQGKAYRIGCVMPAVGILAPFLWTGGKAQFWLAVPTSVFGMVLLPIAYISFFLLMNRPDLLGKAMPRGAKRLVWNLAMVVAMAFALCGSVWSLWSKQGWNGMLVLALFVALCVVVHLLRKRPGKVAE